MRALVERFLICEAVVAVARFPARLAIGMLTRAMYVIIVSPYKIQGAQ